MGKYRTVGLLDSPLSCELYNCDSDTFATHSLVIHTRDKKLLTDFFLTVPVDSRYKKENNKDHKDPNIAQDTWFRHRAWGYMYGATIVQLFHSNHLVLFVIGHP